MRNGRLFKNFLNIIDFLVNSGLSGRGPAWSKILQCRDFGRYCSICSKLDDCESLLTKQNVEVLYIINISDIFLVIMTMMFMLMMSRAMMINKSLREVAKAQQEMSFKIYFANYLRIIVNNLLLSICMSCQLYDMQICYKLQICCHNVLFNTHTQHSLCAFCVIKITNQECLFSQNQMKKLSFVSLSLSFSWQWYNLNFFVFMGKSIELLQLCFDLRVFVLFFI